MNSEPTSPEFIDPNARLLASVIPPPPPTLRARLVRFITTRSSGDVRGFVRWSRSREGRACFLSALAGVALTLGFYRSESSSAASGPAHSPRPERPNATLAASAGVRSEPLALTPKSKAVAALPAEATKALPANEPLADETDAEDGAGDTAAEAALAEASDPTDALRPAGRKAASAKSKKAKSKKAKPSRKAKRQSAARASSRGKRAKSQRATAAGPLAAWLATQRSKEASSSKR